MLVLALAYEDLVSDDVGAEQAADFTRLFAS
jgi:hypothetical protein